MCPLKRSRLVLPAPQYKALCLTVYQRDNYKCRICSQRKPLDPHHIISRRRGGDDASWNLLSVCRNCHDACEKYWVIITPMGGEIGDPVNADKKIRIIISNPEWKPGTPIRGKKK